MPIGYSNFVQIGLFYPVYKVYNQCFFLKSIFTNEEGQKLFERFWFVKQCSKEYNKTFEKPFNGFNKFINIYAILIPAEFIVPGGIKWCRSFQKNLNPKIR